MSAAIQPARGNDSKIPDFRFKIVDCTVTDVSKSAPRIAGMFDAIARRYDFLNHFLSAGIDRRWRRQAVRSLRLTGSERVLDLCTGTGDLAIARVPPTRAQRASSASISPVRCWTSAWRNCGGAASPTAFTWCAATRCACRSQTDRATRRRSPLASGTSRIRLRPAGRCSACSPRAAVSRSWNLPFLRRRCFARCTCSYFKHVLPRLGRLISRHDAAYDYLPASVGAFASPDEFANPSRRWIRRGVDAAADLGRRSPLRRAKTLTTLQLCVRQTGAPTRYGPRRR